MLRISRLTDYGVLLTSFMAARPLEEAHKVGDLAAETGIPQPTVSKVLKHLAREGVLVSQRGVNGGYRLSREPRQLTVAEVITAIEGPIAITDCAHEKTAGECEYEGRCQVQANWRRINHAVYRALEGITLADMAQPQLPVLVTLRARPEPEGPGADKR